MFVHFFRRSHIFQIKQHQIQQPYAKNEQICVSRKLIQNFGMHSTPINFIDYGGNIAEF